MPEGDLPSPKDAAAALRAAVHDLASKSVSIEPDGAALGRAAELVRLAAAEIDGEPFGRWWEGPSESREELGLRHYRHRSIFQGELHPFSPTLRWQDAAGPAGEPGYRFVVELSSLYEGPPNAVHGGYVAALFDELLGGVQALAEGGGGYTGRLTVRYRSLTPVRQPLDFVGWISDDKGRRVHTHATCHASGVLCAEAEALFVRPATP